MMGSSAFPDQLASALKTYLATSALSRDNVARYLEAANLPSRADIATLAARVDELTNVVQSLADMLVKGKKKKKKGRKSDRKAKGKKQ
jgi:hypothetical protein